MTDSPEAQPTSQSASPLPRYILPTIGFLACSMLLFEILLTRVVALRLFFHFAYLVISNCLLAIGAAGSVTYLFQRHFERDPRRWVWLFSVLFVISVVFTYAFLISYPIKHDMALTNAPDMQRFAFFNLVAAIPLFFGGVAVSLLLATARRHINLVYGIDLLGAGLACVLCPILLWQSGAGGCLMAVLALALLAVLTSAPPPVRRVTVPSAIAAILVCLGALPYLDRIFPVPGKQRLDFTVDVSTEIQRPTFTRWTATSRIDLIPWRDKPFIFMRGSNALDMPLPEQKYISQDGSAGTFILNFSDHPELLPVLSKATYSAAYQLKDKPAVFIIGLGGGIDAWAAYANEASRVKAVELNSPIVYIHEEIARDFSRTLIEDDRYEFVAGEGRSALMQDRDTYDVIQMSGIDTWTALSSGAYILAENYLYTKEALGTMYNKLNEGGLINITRFAADMEALRMVSVAAAALAEHGITDLTRRVALIKSPEGLISTLVRKGEFPEEEVARLQAFVEDAGLEVIHMPGVTQSSDNIVSEFVQTADRQKFIHDFPRDITPTTDDRPYFFNYTKWSNPAEAKQYLEEPTVVSQGNPLFVLFQLVLAMVLSVILIAGPVAFAGQSGASTAYAWRFLPYFAALGAGFIIIEVAVMQKFVLFLGHPLYSLTVTLFSMLIFTGVGSLVSDKMFNRLRTISLAVPLLITLLVASIILLSPAVVSTFIGLPLFARILLVGAWLAVLSLPMGIPFAFGVRLLNHYNPTLVPWAWAVNACLSVIGSITAAIISMNFGFTVVLITGVVIYWLGFLAVGGLARRCPAVT